MRGAPTLKQGWDSALEEHSVPQRKGNELVAGTQGFITLYILVCVYRCMRIYSIA